MTAAGVMRWAGITPASAAFAMRTAFIAWFAFALATLLGLHNAYWAAMAVWVISQPTRGLLIERGAYRVVGTIVGAGFGFALLTYVHDPYWALSILAVWVGCCAGLTHLLRQGRTYGAMMAGMTAAVVVAPTMLAPGETFALALARVECTLIGVLAATLLGGLFTPASPWQQFLDRVRRLAGEAVSWAALCLTSMPDEETAQRAGELIAAMGELEQEAATVTAGSFEGQRRIRHVHALIATTLSVMAAARCAYERRLRTTGSESEWQRLHEGLAGLGATLATASPPAPKAAEIVQSAHRLDRRLGDALGELLVAARTVIEDPAEAQARPFQRKAPLDRHNDWPSVRIAAVAAGLATLVVGIAALWLDWAHGHLTVLGVCIFSMLLATMDLPQRIAPTIAAGVLTGVTVAFGFRLLVLPHAGSATDVVLMIAPFMLVGGIARASRVTTGAALDANMCFLLASQPVVSSAATSVAEAAASSAALALSILLVAGGYMLLPRDHARRAQGIARLIVRDLARMNELAASGGADRRHALMHHRILRLMVHVGRAADLRVNDFAGVLAALDLAQAIEQLRDRLADAECREGERALVAKALEALRRFASAPDDVAAELGRYVDEPDAAPAAGALRDASGALTRGAAFFSFGAPGKIGAAVG